MNRRVKSMRMGAVQRHRRLVRVAGLVLAGLMSAAACSTGRPAGGDWSGTDEQARRQRVVLNAPEQLHDLCGLLLRYRVQHGRLPESLELLIDSTTGHNDVQGKFAGFAYRAAGLGRLADGRVILVVDDVVRIENHLWCILEQPTQTRGAAVLDVALVSIKMLRAARAESDESRESKNENETQHGRSTALRADAGWTIVSPAPGKMKVGCADRNIGTDERCA